MIVEVIIKEEKQREESDKMETLKLKMPFNDRMGLILDVAIVLLNYNLNILSLQLMNNVMFLEMENHQPDNWPSLKNELENIAAIICVERIHDMPYESREKQIEAIINSISNTNGHQDAFTEIVGKSKEIKKAILLARQIAHTNSTVMLKGESGTGKELFARAIHKGSGRKDKVFVPVNCGAIPDNLLESELFGYVDGAFSGAKKGGRVGLFQFASGGTLFLDEISELPMHIQVKLLRVLQEDSVRPLGANEEISIDCRIITATNRNLENMIAKGLFREDLFYRLNVIPIRIPPLRQRKEDIIPIGENYLAKYKIRSGKKKSISQEAYAKLIDYEWYGNVRELENVIERAVHLSKMQVITAGDIIFDSDIGLEMDACDSEEYECAENIALRDVAVRAEKELIITMLKEKGSIRKAAKALGVSHTTIGNKIKKYRIDIGKIK